MRKVCIALCKGGVAKSSTAVNVAHGLAMSGKKVLLVDTDDQGQASFLLGAYPTYSLAEVLQEEVDLEKALFEARGNLWVLAGGKSLAGAKRAIARKDFGAEQTLSLALSCIEGRFDFVIVDTSPSWDALTINALFYCREVLTPVSLEVLTLNSLLAFDERLKSVQSYCPELVHKYLLPTFLDRRVKKCAEVLEQLKRYYPQLLCDPIKYCVRISESAGFGKSIYEYAPLSSGAIDYQKLVQRILC
ncbi:MAG: ParA family protein [Candidatus Rhabdochlamydia sp.]